MNGGDADAASARDPAAGGDEPGAAGRRPGVRPGADRDEADGREREPCLRCGVPLPVRLMGCKGGHCPNCGHPYPHGDCSD